MSDISIGHRGAIAVHAPLQRSDHVELALPTTSDVSTWLLYYSTVWAPSALFFMMSK